MSYILWKKIHRCFPGFKCLPPLPSSPPAPSKDQGRDHHNHGSSSSSPVSTSTTTTPTSVLAKNFNSIYDLTDPSNPTHSTSKSFTPSTVTEDLFSSSDDSDVALSLPDFATVCASRRFFFSSPGRSNSIVQSAATATTASEVAASAPETEAETETLAGAGGVAVHKYSPDPYLDFRRSMQEMVEARDLRDVRGDWEYLHELLSSYLRLNPKHTHKFIIDAFTDLIIGLMALPEADKSRKAGRWRRQCGGSMG